MVINEEQQRAKFEDERLQSSLHAITAYNKLHRMEPPPTPEIEREFREDEGADDWCAGNASEIDGDCNESQPCPGDEYGGDFSELDLDEGNAA